MTLAVDVTVARRDFTFAIATTFGPGITCVLGPSGAGKSTLLGAVAGLVQPTRGRVALGAEVWVDTATGVRVPIEARHVAYLFQSLALFPHLDALGNVAYAVPRSVPRPERRERAHALLTRLAAGVGAWPAARPSGSRWPGPWP